MRISNITSVMETRVSPVGNNINDRGIKPSSNDNRDTLSISKSAKNAFQKQYEIGTLLDSLLKQKQNIIDSKNSLIERTTKNGQGLDSIKDQLENYNEQINAIDKQITEYTFKEQQKKIDMDEKENKIPDNQPKTEQETQNEQLNNIVELSNDISQIQVVSSVKSKMHGQAKVLAKEIELDESRSPSGQKAVYKREQLEKIEERVSDITKKIGEALKDTGEKIKYNADHENNAIPEKSEVASIEQTSKISTYKDIQKSSNVSSEKSQLEILA